MSIEGNRSPSNWPNVSVVSRMFMHGTDIISNQMLHQGSPLVSDIAHIDVAMTTVIHCILQTINNDN